MQRLGDLQIANVLKLIGDRGRGVIRDMFRPLDRQPSASESALEPPPRALSPMTQTVKYLGNPRTVAKIDVDALVHRRPKRQGTS